MTVTVRLFARARDLAGTDAIAVELPDGATVQDLRKVLADESPTFARLLSRSAIAVNDDFGSADLVLSPGQEIALLPPVSGGSGGDPK
jgi:molybdopterin converting factor subunit 1